MKKLVSLVLAATLVCAAPLSLAACGSSGGDTGGSTPQEQNATYVTLGDVFAVDASTRMSTFDEQSYIIIFDVDGQWTRVEAELPEGMYDELNAAWEDSQDKVEALLAPLAVTDCVVLDAPSDEEVAALVGKTGADLAAAGYEFSVGTLVVNGNETSCVATYHDFDHLITFEGAVPDENAEDVAAAVAELVVTEAAIQGPRLTMGNA